MRFQRICLAGLLAVLPFAALALHIDSSDEISTSIEIVGHVDVVVTTGDTDTPSADEMRGAMHIADHATSSSNVDYTLPEISTVGIGASACFYDNGGGTGGIILDPDDADVIVLDGTPMAAGEQLESPGVNGDGSNGDYICILAIDADTTWITLGRSGTWVEETPP